MEHQGQGDVPGEQERVAQVHVEDVEGEQATVHEWPPELVELRALRRYLGFQAVDADEVVDFVLEARRAGRELPQMDESGLAALDRLLELTLWARGEGLDADDVPGDLIRSRAASSVDSEDALGFGGNRPGESTARPSLATTPDGRLELRRDLLDAMARQGLSRPAAGATTTNPMVAPVTVPAAVSTAPIAGTATVPPMVPSVASGAVPSMATPAAAVTPSSAAPAAASPLTSPPTGFQPIATAAARPAAVVPAGTTVAVQPASTVQGAAAVAVPPASTVQGATTVAVPSSTTAQGATRVAAQTAPAGQGATSAGNPVASPWPAFVRAPTTPTYTPRGAIPSYGGVTFGSAPLGSQPVPPVQVTPSSVPVVAPLTTSGVPAVSAASTVPAVPRPAVAGASGPLPPPWASRLRAQVTSTRATPAPVVPASSTVTAASQPTYYGGGTPYGVPMGSAPNHYAWQTNTGGAPPVQSTGPVGIRSSVKNAVDMINPFYSDGYTVERARTFWAEFERITRGMEDDLRMTVFRRCMKGKTGEDWWSHSRIADFDTLRVRFHNRFLCISPPQMMERLKTTKRSRGESVEEWADRIRDLCDEASIFDPLMRYQYFLSGIRNGAWTVALQTTMVNSIEEAVAVLLFKNMQIPVERDEDFSDSVPSSKGDPSVQGQLLSMMQQMQAMMSQQQQLLQAPRSPRGRPTVAPVQEAPVMQPGVSAPRQFTGISMAADQRTQEGVVVCGRCNRAGHGRATCPRQTGNCNRCRLQGHYSMECTVPAEQLPKRNFGQSQQPRKSRCLLCGGEGHATSNCSLVQVLRNVAAREAQNASPAPATTAAPARQ